MLVTLAVIFIPRISPPTAQGWTQAIFPVLANATPGCQTDTVHVGYAAAWQPSGGPFVVPTVNVSGLDAACDGATLTVMLEDASSNTISGATGSTIVGSPPCTGSPTLTCPVSISTPPAASAVDNVSVVLTGTQTAGNCVSIPTTGTWSQVGPKSGNYTVPTGNNEETGTISGNVTVPNGATLWLNGGTINGDVTVSSGGQLVATNGATIKGNLTSNGGSVLLQSTTVTGTVNATDGGLDLDPGTAIGGNVTVTSGPQPPPGKGPGTTNFCSLGTSSAPIFIGGVSPTPPPPGSHYASLLYYTGASVPQVNAGSPTTVYYDDETAMGSVTVTDNGQPLAVTQSTNGVPNLATAHTFDTYGGSESTAPTHEAALSFKPTDSGPITITVHDGQGDQDSYTWSSTPPLPAPPSGKAADLQVQNLTMGSPSVQICGTYVTGNLTYQNNAAAGQLGGSASCIGNTVGGDLHVQNNAGAVSIGGSGSGTANNVTGTIQVQKNSGGGNLTDNSAGANCQLQGDKPPIMGSGNYVNGSLQSQTAPNTCNPKSGGA